MKTLSMHIPEPCHEDWQQMTPVDKGRFCQSCAKQVVDFSVMTDQEILNYISKASGGLCGRFADDQLQRPLQPIKQEKKKVWWVAAAMPLLMLFEKGHAQAKDTAQPKVELQNGQPPLIMGEVIAPSRDTTLRTIYGKITDPDGQPIPYARIKTGNKKLASADSGGLFNLSVPVMLTSSIIEISAEGYNSEQLNITADTSYTVVLKPITFALDSTFSITIADTTLECLRTMGLIGVYTEPEPPTLKDTLFNLFASRPFKIFPNPAQRGNNVNIVMNEEGSYTIQLLDNKGNVVFTKQVWAATVKTPIPLSLPSSMATGMYFIRITDERKKKLYTDKIIVM